MHGGPDDPIELRRALGAVLHGVLGRSAGPVRIGRYRLRERLGQGATGTVWLAHDERLDRSVAIKRLRTSSESSHGRLRREAQTLAQLSHPNVVQVFEVVQHDADTFVVMERAHGPTLRQWQQDPRPWREIVAVYLGAGEGLAAAHAKGIVHRDFKPDNVVVTEGLCAKVLDFGLASAIATESTEGAGSKTSGTLRGGTPAYMAPEQWSESPVDPKADQYSFCLALHEALAGRPASVSNGPPASQWGNTEIAASTRPPARLLKVLMRGLAHDRRERWPSMRAMLAQLRAAAGGRQRGTMVGLMSALLGGLGVAALVHHEGSSDDICTRQAQQIEAVWDEAARARVNAALHEANPKAAAQQWPRLRAVLGEHVEAWAEAHAATCVAPSDGRVEPSVTVQRDCLEDRRLALLEVVELFGRADEALAARAVGAAVALPSARSCVDGTEPGDVDEELRAVRRRLVPIDTLALAGKMEAALAELEPIERELRHAQRPRALAVVLYAKGRVLEGLGRFDDADAVLREGYWLASEREIGSVAARCAILLVRIEGRYRGDLQAAQRWGEHARAAMKRHGPSDRLAIRLLVNLGTALEGAGQLEEAVAHYERALARLRAEGEVPEHEIDARRVEVAIMANLGFASANLGRLAEADRLLREALGSERALLGPRHPDTVATLLMLSNVALRRERFDEALRVLEEAQEIAAEALPPRHQWVGKLMLNLGVAHASLSQHARAEDDFRRAKEILTVALGEGHPQLASVEANLADLARERGDLDGARVHIQRAFDITHAAFGEEDMQVIDARHELALALARAGECVAARSHIKEALAMATQLEGRDAPSVENMRKSVETIERCGADSAG